MPSSLKPSLMKVRESLAKLQEGTWEWTSPTTWFGFNGVNAMTVTDDVARKLDRWGEFYVRLGKSPDEAVELAQERVQAGHTVINGNPVPTTDRALPGDFKAVMERKIKGWADTYGARYGYEAGDLTVEPAGDGQQGVWSIVRTNGDGPVLIEEEDARRALTFSLRAAQAEADAAAKGEVIDAQKATQGRRKANAKAGWEEGGLQ